MEMLGIPDKGVVELLLTQLSDHLSRPITPTSETVTGQT
jgi:hypothetical protein